MAKQTGILPMTGKLGGLSFYHHKYYGMLVRQSNPVSRERYKNDPSFVRSRENNDEMGRTSTNAALLRNGLRSFMFELGTGRLDNMMMKRFCKIRNEDTVSDRGKRSVRKSLELNPEQLGGFDLDPTHKLDWFLDREPVVDRTAGTITVKGYVPTHVPQGATHVAFAGVRARLDFDRDRRDVKEGIYVYRSLGQSEFGSESEDHGQSGFGSESEDVVLDLSGEMGILDGFEVWGVKVLFFQEVNGEMYALRVGAARLIWSGLSAMLPAAVVESQEQSEGQSESEVESEGQSEWESGSEEQSEVEGESEGMSEGVIQGQSESESGEGSG